MAAELAEAAADILDSTALPRAKVVKHAAGRALKDRRGSNLLKRLARHHHPAPSNPCGPLRPHASNASSLAPAKPAGGALALTGDEEHAYKGLADGAGAR